MKKENKEYNNDNPFELAVSHHTDKPQFAKKDSASSSMVKDVMNT
jgi:hypothetical protein